MWLYDHNTWNFDSLTEDHYDTHNLEKEFFKKKKKRTLEIPYEIIFVELKWKFWYIEQTFLLLLLLLYY